MKFDHQIRKEDLEATAAALKWEQRENSIFYENIFHATVCIKTELNGNSIELGDIPFLGLLSSLYDFIYSNRSKNIAVASIQSMDQEFSLNLRKNESKIFVQTTGRKSRHLLTQCPLPQDIRIVMKSLVRKYAQEVPECESSRLIQRIVSHYSLQN